MIIIIIIINKINVPSEQPQIATIEPYSDNNEYIVINDEVIVDFKKNIDFKIKFICF
jgi:hypothetical protein